MTLDKHVRFETLQSRVCFFINGFTRAAFMDLGKTPRGNDLLTIFVIEFIRTSRQSFTSHVGIGLTAQKALDDFFINCLISVSVKGSNVSIMDMQDSSTNGVPCDKVLDWNPLCIFNIFDRRSY
jgi:hypothetical protein